ncbi:MAG: hypothetical protein DHS20C07_19070 [Methyloligella sp.]|nr:MAG: hypothetical protein DHS20C07_19070 [Methyloligella sp.]
MVRLQESIKINRKAYQNFNAGTELSGYYEFFTRYKLKNNGLIITRTNGEYMLDSAFPTV